MPAIASISTNDGTTAHVYTPHDQSNDRTVFTERTGAPIGDPSITISVKTPRNGAELYKTRLTFKVPSLVTVDGVDSVDFSTSFFLDAVSNHRATTAQVTSALTEFVDLLSSGALTFDAIVNREPVY